MNQVSNLHFNFSDKTVLVTGAAGNLGRAVAQVFFDAGARLVLADRAIESLQGVYGKETSRVLLAPLDLLQQEQVDTLAAQATERFGGIDVLCNIAGGFRMGPAVHETPDQDWNFLFDLNTRSLLHAVRAVMPRMLAAGSGKVVSVAANAAAKGVAHMGAYCASKDAVIRLTEAMAAEVREKGVNVNCVLPSIIDTPDNRAAMPGADPARWVAPELIAQTIAFLASDAARAIHGASIPVVGLS
jgi:NAD(P)-dependent dehydrogenase (short-subunit alcohol dehydrogenase family)